MLFFVFGLFVGGCLGVFFVAMLVKSKQGNEVVCRFMEEKDWALLLKESLFKNIYH